MWVFIPGIFVSVVAHRERPDHVIVRARRREDLEEFFGRVLAVGTGWDVPAIEATPTADYPFRVMLERERFADVMELHAAQINYDNFKAAPGNEDRQLALIKVWMAMRDLQHGVPAT